MARRSSATVAAEAAAVADEQPGEDIAVQSGQTVEVPADDVEAWVAAVFDYQNNGGPKPVRS